MHNLFVIFGIFLKIYKNLYYNLEHEHGNISNNKFYFFL